ncbi:similar to Saccharomyces cerevisiae YER180C-A SLO1 Protein interacting with Arl3p, which is a GTPase of the Ras superfamily involved in vesicle- tethering at the Golgi [Maudiozyma barnettii]|uniref:Similar to Saccharomyces cerevisiae YER180C-A SLO1 Protein interacting with Arl3p, which is a GTPase of the Ras superfamily involved in vesicle- tethering at the Golgi n=1 Tax=Maudiozyma barnettii TaxID=61262 RepID=A0A8H2VHI0_9SACH|nr:Slo1p [Kazachstania barnettii]CAB4255490.1 similar to Saccharomyces cerevisiae YER180C-A SLO1 Protein interacting with Arl3p, which is a GTPase of the Ras superfamily involved in vesicle- tethering at the Golgi [Kazachstania barnettii]CAD1783983.1 similar to Saccharomyces cerevisiae YER180C-A SLO1 Protein interacting with Arl3p, which is a GTPase of the Ras superfamily involved in vesicle- tethering at the Golgi [Kazachstania barnettii]
MSEENVTTVPITKEPNNETEGQLKAEEGETSFALSEEQKNLKETKLLRDTLDLLWDKTLEQRKVCEQLQQENEYLHDYIDNLMSSSNVLDK